MSDLIAESLETRERVENEPVQEVTAQLETAPKSELNQSATLAEVVNLEHPVSAEQLEQTRAVVIRAVLGAYDQPREITEVYSKYATKDSGIAWETGLGVVHAGGKYGEDLSWYIPKGTTERPDGWTAGYIQSDKFFESIKYFLKEPDVDRSKLTSVEQDALKQAYKERIRGLCAGRMAEVLNLMVELDECKTVYCNDKARKLTKTAVMVDLPMVAGGPTKAAILSASHRKTLPANMHEDDVARILDMRTEDSYKATVLPDAFLVEGPFEGKATEKGLNVMAAVDVKAYTTAEVALYALALETRAQNLADESDIHAENGAALTTEDIAQNLKLNLTKEQAEELKARLKASLLTVEYPDKAPEESDEEHQEKVDAYIARKKATLPPDTLPKREPFESDDDYERKIDSYVLQAESPANMEVAALLKSLDELKFSKGQTIDFGLDLRGEDAFVDILRAGNGFKERGKDNLVVLRFPADIPDGLLQVVGANADRLGYKILIQKLPFTRQEIQDLGVIAAITSSHEAVQNNVQSGNMLNQKKDLPPLAELLKEGKPEELYKYID